LLAIALGEQLTALRSNSTASASFLTASIGLPPFQSIQNSYLFISLSSRRTALRTVLSVSTDLALPVTHPG
jgi:hypothetical protein